MVCLEILKYRIFANIKAVATFQKASFPLMRADTQFSVVEATLKGYQKWIIAHGRSPQEDVRSKCVKVSIIFANITK